QHVETGAAQSAPRREDRNGFQEVGLARAIGAGQHQMALIKIKRCGSVVAEGREPEAGDVTDHWSCSGKGPLTGPNGPTSPPEGEASLRWLSTTSHLPREKSRRNAADEGAFMARVAAYTRIGIS